MKNKKTLKTNHFLEIIIKSWISYLFFVFITTELLSFFNLVGRTPIIIVYSIIGLLVFSCLLKNKISIDLQFLKNIKKTDKFILLLLIFTILLPLLFTALYYPPNNWDSMTYHMARVMHWVQNQNVSFYFTQNDRQLFSGPLAEYVILHWYLLINSDLLSNLVQYFSLLITAIASYLITKFLSNNRKHNLLSIVLVLTTPMAIMQSTSTQNDLVVSSILLSTVYFGFKKSWLFFGLSVGLGILTKNTYALFALPFCIYFGIKWLKEYKHKVILLFLWFLFCVVLINFHHWYRNYQAFNSPVGPKYMSEMILNVSHKKEVILSNMIKNFGLQVGLPNDRYNLFIDRLVYKLHEEIHLNLNAHQNTFNYTTYKTQFSIHEDLSGNFILTIIILVSLIALFRKKELFFYWICLLGGWVSFNYFLKWQPWGSRLLLPLFMISIPFASYALGKIIKIRKIMYLVIVFLIIFSWPFIAGSNKYFGNLPVTLSSNRQILPLPEYVKFNRTKRYFYGRQDLYEEVVNVATLLREKGVSRVELDLGYDDWEYTWWVALKNKSPSSKIEIITKNEQYIDNTASILNITRCSNSFEVSGQILYNSTTFCVVVK